MGKSKVIISVLVSLLFLLSSLYQDSPFSFIGGPKSFHASAQKFALTNDIEEQGELEEAFKRQLFFHAFESISSILFPRVAESFGILYQVQCVPLVSQVSSTALPSRAPPVV